MILMLSGCGGTKGEEGMGTVTAYSMPSDLPEIRRGSMHRVSANSIECPVYATEVTVGYDCKGYISGVAEYVSFELDGGYAEVTVGADYKVVSAEIQPSSEGISCEIVGNSINFRVEKAGQYFVKINGNLSNGATVEHPLYIFVDPPMEDVPAETDENTVVFKAGYHQIGSYVLQSNTVYYLEAGAYVCGQLISDGAENVRICGRGILSGEFVTADVNEGRAIFIRNGKNITLEGITVVHPWYWTVEFDRCNGVTVNNIKTISHGMSSDALDIFGCSDVTVENSFFRSYDDVVVIKAQPAECRDIVVKNCVLWCDSSNPMEIGYETHYDTSNVLFEDIDVLSVARAPHSRTEAVIAIEPHYGGNVYDVVYRDIRVEPELVGYELFRFSIDDGSGSIGNITLENVRVNGALGGIVRGKEGVDGIEGIRLINVTNTQGCTPFAEDILTFGPVGDIEIQNTSEAKRYEPKAHSELYSSLADFSEIQGQNGFYYYSVDNAGMTEMEFNGTCWKLPGADYPLIQWGGMHCETSRDAMIAWEAPRDGRVVIRSQASHPNMGGDGVEIAIYKNMLFSPLYTALLEGDFEGIDVAEPITVAVRQGDVLYFSENCVENMDCDSVIWIFEIEYINDNEGIGD